MKPTIRIEREPPADLELKRDVATGKVMPETVSLYGSLQGIPKPSGMVELYEGPALPSSKPIKGVPIGGSSSFNFGHTFTAADVGKTFTFVAKASNMINGMTEPATETRTVKVTAQGNAIIVDPNKPTPVDPNKPNPTPTPVRPPIKPPTPVVRTTNSINRTSPRGGTNLPPLITRTNAVRPPVVVTGNTNRTNPRKEYREGLSPLNTRTNVVRPPVVVTGNTNRTNPRAVYRESLARVSLRVPTPNAAGGNGGGNGVAGGNGANGAPPAIVAPPPGG